MTTTTTTEWWKTAVVYQIYPISFFDSNGDGFGDLPGIVAKLDYLKHLGVDVLWLSPIYRSPLADMGYDISDYRAIDPRYGTLEDWDALLAAVHARGMKLMMDLVVNHTSDEHEWFRQSRDGGKTNNPKRDWYIWRPPTYAPDGTRLPPNNWKSVFQGSAWDFDPASGEYYLHLYVAKQPDLNWENPDVRTAVWDVMRFWIDRGCDGFRMDVINLISKAPGLPDAPVVDPKDAYQPADKLFANGPRVHEFIQEMHSEVLSHHDLITVGETPFTHDASVLASYVLPSRHELNMVFQFELMDLDAPQTGEHLPLEWRQWRVPELGAVIARWQQYKRAEGYWNAVFLENHDHARSVSRFGNDAPPFRARSAQLLALLQTTQGGTLYVYQGEELGMANFPLEWGIEEYKDVATQNYWELVKAQRAREGAGAGEVDMRDVLEACQKKARDHARTPMQWSAGPHAGFTAGTPWMRVNDDYAETWNAEAQVGVEGSVWAFWQRALAVRKRHDVLIYGDFNHLTPTHERVLAYTRTWAAASALVLLNFTEGEVQYAIERAAYAGRAWQFVLGNYPASEAEESLLEGGSGEVLLRRYEGRVYIS